MWSRPGLKFMVWVKLYYKEKLNPCNDWISSYQAFKLRNIVSNLVAFGLIILHQKSKMWIGDKNNDNNDNDGQILSKKVESWRDVTIQCINFCSMLFHLPSCCAFWVELARTTQRANTSTTNTTITGFIFIFPDWFLIVK